MTAKKLKITTPAIGRPPIPAEDRSKVRALRLTDAEWAKLRVLGGVDWLRERIARARVSEDRAP